MDRFHDRRDAGRQLADHLSAYRGRDAIVLALPRGGVPVGHEVATALGLPLDVLLVRKIGAPGQPELAVGAVAQGRVEVRNRDLLGRLGISDAEFAGMADRKTKEVEERLQLFRGDRPLPHVAGRTAILVDDGVATGSTALAGVEALHRMGAERIVVAVPVLSPQARAELEAVAEDVVYVRCPDEMVAVGRWYEDFQQTSDEEVMRFLAPEAVHGGR